MLLHFGFIAGQNNVLRDLLQHNDGTTRAATKQHMKQKNNNVCTVQNCHSKKKNVCLHVHS